MLGINEQVCLARSTMNIFSLHYVIAGGYPRDRAFHVKPRDCDIWVWGVDKGKFVEAAEMFARATKMPLHEPGNNEYAEPLLDSRILKVLKCGDIDFILCGPDVRSAGCVVDGFDCNLNQYALDADNKPVFLGVDDPKTHGYIQTQVVDDARRAYMREKATQLGVRV